MRKANELERSTGKRVIHMEKGDFQGDEFRPAPHIEEACAKAIEDGHVRYVPGPGLPELRDAIAEEASRRGRPTVREEVLITMGAKHALTQSLLTLVDSGDEVIFPNPGYPPDEFWITYADGRVVYAPLVEPDFHFDLDELAKLMTPRTKLLIINTPQRPNGMTVGYLEDLSALCTERNVMVLSDEIFSHMVYPPAVHRTIAGMPGMADRTLLVDTFSKTYVMTGFRIGWCVANRDLITAMDIFQQNSVTNVPAFVQMAALAALTGPQDHVEARRELLQSKRDKVVSALNEMPGIECPAPDGSFYVFPDIRGTGMTAQEFTDYLIDNYSVGVVAGTAFGDRGEGHVRITYAAPDDVLDEGLEERPMTTFTTERTQPSQDTSGRALTFAAVCLGFFAVILDTTIVNVALPAIGASFHTTVTNLQWAVNGYNLVFAALLLTCGALSDRRGGKWAFGFGTAIFVIGSLICGVAPDFPALLFGRVVQGLGASLLIPASLALIAHAYPEPAERTRAVAAWGACAGAGFAAGPVVGGVLVDAVGWRAIFLVNLAVGAIAITLLARYATETATGERRMDIPGQILGVVTLTGLAFGITEAGAYGWASPFAIVPLGVALVALVAFVATERKIRSPMLPPSLLSHRDFSAAAAVGLLLNFGIYGQVFVLSLYFQRMRHFSALDTGLMLLPFAALTMILPPVTGRLTARFGPRHIMIIGQALAAAGTAMLALAGPRTAYPVLVPGLVLLGVGMAGTQPSMTAAVMLAAPREFAGIASGVLNAARQVGGVLGVALLGALIADKAHFVTGMHVALAIVAGTFLVGAMLATRCARLRLPAPAVLQREHVPVVAGAEPTSPYPTPSTRRPSSR